MQNEAISASDLPSSHVRPIVEHDSIIWSPYTAKNIESVETVQHRFTKHLLGFRSTDATGCHLQLATSVEVYRMFGHSSGGIRCID